MTKKKAKKTTKKDKSGSDIKPLINNKLVQSAKSVVQFFRDERTKLLLAFLLVFFSALLVLAFCSYLFTWEADQSKLDERRFSYIFDNSITVDNWAGKTGAVLANMFMHDWFGISSFGLVFLLVVYSFKLIKIEILPMAKTLRYTIVAMIWTSITMGYLFGNAYFILGGSHGYFLSSWLVAVIGSAGTTFVLLLGIFAFILFTNENAFTRFRLMIRALVTRTKRAKQKAVTPETKSVTDEELKDSFEEAELKKKNTKTDKTTNTQEYIIRDDGSTEIVDLGFEVDNRKTEEEEIANTTQSEIGGDNETTPEVSRYAPIEGIGVFSLDGKEYASEKLVLNVTRNKELSIDDVDPSMLEDYDPTADLSNYKYPSPDLLENHKVADSEVTSEELKNNKDKIVETLSNFKIEILKIKAMIGPTITLYEIVPAPGIRISKIRNLEDDIALSLAALGIRIIAPMPGRGTIGIEVPNQKPEIVSMRSVISSLKFQNTKYELPLALGKTISNETYVVDLAKMPHLLVAGATGQGKSVGLNAILASLLYKKHPSQIKFILVDPKKVELTLYERIERHYLAMLPDAEEAIITDNQKVIHTLASLNIEMDNRYSLLKAAHVRNIKEYNAKFIARKLNPYKGHKYMPYLILVIDEFADLIMTAGKEVELPIARLAQLARAVGIHLIVATQRPSTNIITGVIKANFPTRLAFKVASMIDSRTILDSPGANQLIGRGDMLITQGSDLVRLQCAFIDTPELEKITKYISGQQGYPTAFILPEHEQEEGDGIASVDLSKRDALFDDAARVIVMSQQGSTSLIQRKLSVGYNRAGRIIDQLEAAGIVGAFEGSKARQVLYPDEYSLEQFLNTLNK